MGNNAAMTVFEAQVIAAHDKGILTLELLDILAEPYRNTDIDSGGMRHIKTREGKGLYQVVVETVEPGQVPPPDPYLQDKVEQLAEGEEYPSDYDDPDWYDAYDRITRQRWEMW